MSPVQYASTINIGVLDSQLLILLLMLQHSGVDNSKVTVTLCIACCLTWLPNSQSCSQTLGLVVAGSLDYPVYLSTCWLY